MSNVQGKKPVPQAKRPRSGSFKQGKKTEMVVAYKATNVPRNKLASWNGSRTASVYVCHGTAYPVPDMLVTKLRASQTLTFTSGAAGAFASSSISLNNPADPFAAIGSVQPRFYDQISALYANAIVYGTKVKVKILKASGGATTRLLFVPTRNNTVPLTSAYADADELPFTMRWDINTSTSQSANGALPLIEDKEKSRYLDIGQFWGRNRAQIMSEANFTSVGGADPSWLVFGYFCVQELEATTQTSVVAEVTLTQYVAFTNVIGVGAS